MEGQLRNAHFVLDIPIIAIDEYVEVFKTSQVGILVEGNTCIYYEIPLYLYVRDGNFYEISLENCKRHNDLYICSMDVFSNITSCLQKGHQNCFFHRRTCHNIRNYAMSQSGVLIRNNVKDDTYAINNKGLSALLKLSEVNTAYVSWENTEAIQIGTIQLQNPNRGNIILTPEIINFNYTNLQYYIDNKNVTDTFTNICKDYNTSLNDLMGPLILNSHAKNLIDPKFWIIVVLSIIILAIVAWLIILQVQLLKIRSLLTATMLFKITTILNGLVQHRKSGHERVCKIKSQNIKKH